MQRSVFIRNLFAIGAFQFLPKGVAASHFQKLYLLQTFVAGFRHYKGMDLLEKMKEGDVLQLIREPDNTHDSCAIALHWNDEKVGYIPKDENKILSRLLDANAIDLIAEITHLNKEVEPWENLSIAISFLKEIRTNDNMANLEYLSVLKTPTYRSYKRNDEDISNNWNQVEKDYFYNDPNWYDFLESNYPNNDIYNIIHLSDVKPNYVYGLETGDYLLVNKNHLPLNENIQKVVDSAEEVMEEIDGLFDEKGYIVMSTQEAESIIKHITSIGDIADTLGRHYIELKFG